MRFLLFNIAVTVAAVCLLIDGTSAIDLQTGHFKVADLDDKYLSHAAKVTKTKDTLGSPQFASQRKTPDVAQGSPKLVATVNVDAVTEAPALKVSALHNQAKFMPKRPVSTTHVSKRNSALDPKNVNHTSMSPQMLSAALGAVLVLFNGQIEKSQHVLVYRPDQIQ